MGAKCGKHKDLEIRHQNDKRVKKQGFKSFEQARQWVRSEFPTLRGFPVEFRDQKGSEISNDSQYKESLKSSKKKVVFQVLKMQNPKLEPLFLNDLAKGVFKLRRKDNDVEGLGILVSNKHFITTTQSLKTIDQLKQFTALFDGKEIQFKSDGLFYKFCGGHFVVAELDGTTDSFIKLDTQFRGDLDTSVYCFYCLRQNPLLLVENSKVIEWGSETGVFKVPLKNAGKGSQCAPVFNAQAELLGLAFELSEETKFLGTHKLASELLSALSKTDKEDVKEMAKQVLGSSGIPYPETDQAMDSDVSSMTEEFQFAESTCHLDFDKYQLRIVSPNDYDIYTVELWSEIQRGAVPVVTSKGIFITGGDSPKSAYLYNGEKFFELPSMHRKHKAHVALIYKEKVCVVSGYSTKSVELLNKKTWELLPQLDHPVANASGVVYKESIFLFGGEKGKTPEVSRAILMLEGDSWKKLHLKLPEKLVGLGTIVLRKDKVLIFGGDAQEEDFRRENLNSWELGLESLDLEEGPKLVKANWFQNQVAYGDSEKLLFAKSGEILRYSKNKLQYLSLCE